MTTQLVFEEVHRSRHQLVFNYRVDDVAFSTVYWYDTVNFFELESRFGRDFMRRVYFHLLAFEANKAASLQPALLDLGPYREYGTRQFFDLWGTIFKNVWGVWRHNNDITDYFGPEPDQPAQPSGKPVELAESGRLLSLCGGGKDSLVSAKLLERAEIPFDVMVYSHSIYGRAQRQHNLIDGMLEHTAAENRHRAWVYDSALDSPAAQLYPEYGVKGILAAETVSSYWTALPIALQHNYTRVAPGVTKSTDEHNLVWDKTGEEINYLWGMSTTAEKLLHDYIRAELVSNLSCFHLLRPIYDVVVFNLLARDSAAVPSTHSCAQQKPWCCNCPKCIYVWMHLVAYLDEGVVAQMFDRNLFDMPENRTYIRKMLGLEGYKPNDCMGTISETRIAYLLCRAKGKTGRAVQDIEPGDILVEVEPFLQKYVNVDPLLGAIPQDLYERIKPQLVAGAAQARQFVRAYLSAS